MNWSIFIPFGAVIALLAVMAIFLLNGKGAFLIAGYNTMPSAKKARYDEKALCRCTGWLLLGLWSVSCRSPWACILACAGWHMPGWR